MIKNIEKVLAKYWGYEGFLPLQRQAMECITRGKDSIVVLPTGGGKSLCFQAPAVAMPGLAVVVSPLISLMKDQVDALAECGVAAARIDSSLSAEEQNSVISRILNQTLRLLYISKSGQYNVLNVTESGWHILRGKQIPRLLEPAQRPAKASKIARDSWEGVNRGLFEALRRLRSKISGQKKVPAYIIFGDRVLREMARRRPSTFDGLLEIKGVGEKKRQQYGKAVLATIKDYCRVNSLEMDV